jgi:hypothetical protein
MIYERQLVAAEEIIIVRVLKNVNVNSVREGEEKEKEERRKKKEERRKKKEEKQ